MKHIKILILLIILCSLAGCDNEIDYLAKDKEPKLVINALLNAETSLNFLYVNLTGKTDIEEVKDAKVEVYINNELKEIALPADKIKYIKGGYIIKSSFKVGDIVKISVKTIDDKYHAWAEIKVPERIFIDSVDTTTIKEKQRYMKVNDYMRYKIKFRDRPNEKNYYRIILEQRNTTNWIDSYGQKGSNSYLSTSMIIRDDIVLTDGSPSTIEDEENGILAPIENRYSVFDDSRFTNSSYTMTVSQSIPLKVSTDNTTIESMTSDVTIRLMSITEHEYHYLRSLSMYYSDEFIERISEPIRFPSNVKGGTGIIGISSESKKTMRIINDHI